MMHASASSHANINIRSFVKDRIREQLRKQLQLAHSPTTFCCIRPPKVIPTPEKKNAYEVWRRITLLIEMFAERSTKGITDTWLDEYFDALEILASLGRERNMIEELIRNGRLFFSNIGEKYWYDLSLTLSSMQIGHRGQAFYILKHAIDASFNFSSYIYLRDPFTMVTWLILQAVARYWPGGVSGKILGLLIGHIVPNLNNLHGLMIAFNKLLKKTRISPFTVHAFLPYDVGIINSLNRLSILPNKRIGAIVALF